jgi:FAD/FMN-containing dehydrogenase/Fe-S oxidoreductase
VIGPRLHAALDGRLDGELRTDAVSRSLWATDASIYRRDPAGVVLARSEADVRRAIGAARATGVPVTARGTGTSLAGEATSPGLVLDTSGMDRLLELDVAAATARVEPGLIQGHLNALAAPHGLVFGADTSTAAVATLGGMIGNDSAGMRSIVYGRTRDQVLGLRCILSDGLPVDLAPMPRAEAITRAQGGDRLAGLLRTALELGDRFGDEVRRRYPRILRRVSGYGLDALLDPDVLDLARLVCGSEGTLAVTTRADVRLHPLPPVRGMASLQFATLAEAARATPLVLGERPSAVELLDHVAIEHARANRFWRDSTSFVHGDPAALLLVEWSGTAEEVAERLEAAAGIGRAVGANHVQLLPEAADQAQTVRLRASILPLLLGRTENAKPVAFVEDAAVAPERLEEFVVRFEELLDGEGTWACFYGHASVGCLHVRPALDVRDPADVARMRRIAERVADLVIELGGSLSGEHGDGLSRSEFLERMYGPALIGAFAELKAAWDPDGLLNPGVIVAPARMDADLRISPQRHGAQTLPTKLDFSRQGSFISAIELCNGTAQCRKVGAGSMCPSFMVTRDERDTTRARANALRSVLDGSLPFSELTGPGLHEVMDLCVGCKACVSECPSGVDVASMKIEVLAQTGAAHGFSLRQRAAGSMRRSLELAGHAPWLVNAVGSTRMARRAAEAIGGIDRRRRLPRVAPATFAERFGSLPQGDGPEVALFNDTWTNHQRPDIGEAAVRVLAAAGARVLLPDVVCCGRTMLSEGLVDDARRQAERNMELLDPLAQAGIPLAGLEPSCILTIRDDYARLLPGDPRVERVAAATRLFEEALLDLQPPPLRPGGPVVLHAHCHQKALVGAAPTVRALELAPGTTVQTLDSGCCGMAGLFGYEREHYDVSMRMGERVLFPAVRAAGDADVVAPGTSCREQIHDGTGREAEHPAQWLRRRLA